MCENLIASPTEGESSFRPGNASDGTPREMDASVCPFDEPGLPGDFCVPQCPQGRNLRV